jgi:hypothetical protein
MTWFEIKEKRKFEFGFKLSQVHLPLIHYNYMVKNCRLLCNGCNDTWAIILEPSASHGQVPHILPCCQAPVLPPQCPPVSIEQLLVTQNELTRMLMENEAHYGVGRLQHPHQQDMNLSYSNFLMTHPPLFSEIMDPLEADNWLRTTNSMFELIHYMEYQKTLYAACNTPIVE